MLQSISSFFNFIYELIFGKSNKNKKKKHLYDREYNEYQKTFASREYIEDEYGNVYSDEDDEYYNSHYYYDSPKSQSTPTNKRNQLRKRRIRRKKIFKKPPFINPDNA